MASILVKLIPVVLLSSFVNCGEWTITLEYSLNEFSDSHPLGVIELRRNFDGNHTGVFKPTADAAFGKRLFEFFNKRYSVKAVSSNDPGQTFISSNTPCHILRAGLFHLFWVSVNGDHLTSLTVFPDSVATLKDASNSVEETCPPTEIGKVLMQTKAKGAPRGTVHVSGKKQAPVPDTASFVSKIEREQRARQQSGNGEQDNRSFLGKYWMYIVPAVVLMLISNAVAPPEEGAQQQ